MKVSISLSDDDLAFLDRYATEHSVESRSAAIQRAVRLLRAVELADDYERAWAEWQDGDDAEAWEVTASDGRLDAPR